MIEKFPNDISPQTLLETIRNLSNRPRSSFGELVSEGLQIQSGWSFAYNLDPVFINIVTTGTGTVTHDESFAVIQSGTDPNATAEIVTKRALAYTPGVGAMARFTAIFDIPKENCQQMIGIGNTTDGWYFGYNGLKFGIVRINDSVETWTYQSSWTDDQRPCLNPQRGNVYQIDFQWLGFGDQYFSIEDREGNITRVHRIGYANKFTNVSVQNPSLPLTAKVINTGNITNVTLKTPSSVAGSYGQIDSSAFEFPIGFDQLGKATIANTETYLFSIRNPVTYLSKANRLYILPSFLSLASEGTKPVVIRAYFNSTLTGAVFNDVATGISPLQADVAATAFSGGLKVLTTTLGSVDRDTIDLSSFRGLISPTGSLTFTALSKNSSEITTGLTSKSRV